MKKHILLGRLATLAGIPKSVAGRYLKLGLIAPTDKTRAGYPLFNPETILTVIAIRKWELAGWPVQVIKRRIEKMNV